MIESIREYEPGRACGHGAVARKRDAGAVTISKSGSAAAACETKSGSAAACEITEPTARPFAASGGPAVVGSGVRRRARLARRTPYGPRAPHGSFVSAPLARNDNPRPAGFGSTADPNTSCNVLEFCALAPRNCLENAMSSSFALSLEGLKGLRRMRPKADLRFRPRALSCPGAGRTFQPARECKTRGHCKKEAFPQADGGIGGDVADGIRAMASACRFGRAPNAWECSNADLASTCQGPYAAAARLLEGLPQPHGLLC